MHRVQSLTLFGPGLNVCISDREGAFFAPLLFIFETTREITMKLGSVVLWTTSFTYVTIGPN